MSNVFFTDHKTFSDTTGKFVHASQHTKIIIRSQTEIKLDMYFHFLILYNGLERIRIKTMTSHDRFHGHAITLNFEANRDSLKNSGNEIHSP